MEKALFKNLLSSTKQARDISKGKLKPSRQFIFKPEDIVQIRKQLSMSQNDFSNLLKIPTATLRNWEQGRTIPDAPAQTLLFIAHKRPQVLSEILGDITLVYGATGALHPSRRGRTASQSTASHIKLKRASKSLKQPQS